MPTPSETRRRIVEASVRLFARQGIAATTTKHIAAEARIAEGTIYRHFPSKEAMADAIFLENYLPFADALDVLQRRADGLVPKIRAMVEHFYAAFDRDRDLFSYLLLGPHAATMRIPTGTPTPVSVLRAVIDAGMAAGSIRRSDPALTTHLVLGLMLQPAEAVALGELPAPLLAHAPGVVEAIERTITP